MKKDTVESSLRTQSQFIGDMVRFHRKKARLTQKQMATCAGLGKTVIFDLENGKESIRLDTLLKVIHVLNIKIQFTGPLMDLFLGQM